MEKLNYEIVGVEVQPFTYRHPLIVVNEDGEVQISYSQKRDDAIHIKRITFLSMVGRDANGHIKLYKPIEHVNRFLMAHHIDDGREESSQYSKALIHFFSFLTALQEKWDAENDGDLFDEVLGLQRPSWNYMAPRKAHRITYQYRAALKYSVINESDKNLRLARTTASAYMNAVVKFYSYHIRQGHKFNNPPFEHETYTIHFEAPLNSMKSYMTKAVQTTDLRLNFPKSKRNEGGVIPEARRDLAPLTNKQWLEVENIILNTRKVLKNVNGQKKLTRLAEEYCLLFLVIRYSGLRKEEAASLHCGQVVKPNLEQPIMRLGIGCEYGSLTKSKSGTNKSRKTIIPCSTMQMLYEYSCSQRYLKRLEKFRALCQNKRESGDVAFFESIDGVDENKDYLFISNSGIPFFLKLNELNNRWNEVRSTVEEVLGQKINGTIHNLRSTFAVAIFRALLRKVSSDIALAIVSDLLGHEDIKTTMLYLKIAENAPTGDEIYEDVLDFVGVFDELEALDDKLYP